ncbi:MAG: hypothetical protein R3Y11_03420 [Pseudomonadota bacterium]
MKQNILETLLVFTYTLLMQEKYVKASSVLGVLYSIAPDNVNVLRQYAVSLLQINNPEKALECTQQLLVLERSPHRQVMARHLHASALWQLGKADEATDFLQNATHCIDGTASIFNEATPILLEK